MVFTLFVFLMARKNGFFILKRPVLFYIRVFEDVCDLISSFSLMTTKLNKGLKVLIWSQTLIESHYVHYMLICITFTLFHFTELPLPWRPFGAPMPVQVSTADHWERHI